MNAGETFGLVTAFEPFAGLSVNPSERLLERLDGLVVAGITVETALLPVSLERGPAALGARIRQRPPVFVMMMGLAAGAAVIRVEMLAVNVAAIRGGDNDGRFAAGEALDPLGPPARHATWDGLSIAGAIEAVGVPARVSFHAGTHLCNAVLYTALGLIDTFRPRPPCGLLHLPLLPEQALSGAEVASSSGPEAPSMAADMQFAAAEAAIGAMVRGAAAIV